MAQIHRDDKITKEQKELLVIFMEANLEFARGKLVSIEGRMESNRLSSILKDQLNEIGPEKSVQKWQRVWTQLKTKVKRKAATLSASREKTGGGPPIKEPALSTIEEKIIFIISKEGIYGLEGPDGVSLESDVPFVDINLPSTSTSVSETPWIDLTETGEITESDTESHATGASTPTDGPTTPKRIKRTLTGKDKGSDIIGALMEQNETTNNKIEKLSSNINDVKNILGEILHEYKNTNRYLDRIACALENKK